LEINSGAEAARGFINKGLDVWVFASLHKPKMA
jgi:hypothetical protein